MKKAIEREEARLALLKKKAEWTIKHGRDQIKDFQAGEAEPTNSTTQKRIWASLR